MSIFTKGPSSLFPDMDPAMTIEPMADTFIVGLNADGQPVHAGAFTAAKSAAAKVFDIAGKLSDAERAIASLGNQPDPQTDTRLRRNARAAMAQARKALDDAFASLGEHSQTLANEAEQLVGTHQARASVTDNARGAEVRGWLRGMTPSQRTDAINEALTAGDQEIISSVLAASPVLSGMERDHHTSLAADARARFAPDQHRILGGIEHLVRALRDADTTLNKRFGGLTGEGDSRHAAVERAIGALEPVEGGA